MRAGYKSNFVGGGPAELEFDGKRSAFIGTAIDDRQIVGQRMRSVLDASGIKDGSRALGLKIGATRPRPASRVRFQGRRCRHRLRAGLDRPESAATTADDQVLPESEALVGGRATCQLWGSTSLSRMSWAREYMTKWPSPS